MVSTGCEAPPERLAQPTETTDIEVIDRRLPDEETLAQLFQVDGSAIALGEASSEQGDSTAPGQATPIESEVSAEEEEEPANETLVFARPIRGDETDDDAIQLKFAELQAALSSLAATADDPTPYELAAALLPLIAVPELVDGTYPEYAPRIEDLASDEETLVLGTAHFASAVRRRLDAGEAPTVVIASELERLQENLQDDHGLRISTVALCSAIRGFGDFDEMPVRLPTRADRDALVYIALDGLDWQASPTGGDHRWQIDHRIELRQLSDGFVVDPGRWTVQSHSLSSPSRDSFLWVRIRLPIADLSAGRYGLKVRVREPSTGREAEQSLMLELVPPRLLTEASTD